MSEPSSPEVVIPLEVTVDVKEPEKKILSLAQKLILLQEIVPDVKSTKGIACFIVLFSVCALYVKQVYYMLFII